MKKIKATKPAAKRGADTRHNETRAEVISQILSRGVDEVIDRKDLESQLRSGKKLRIKLGIDPTSKNIHLGRAVALWKLRQLQDIGHKIVAIIGDFTGVVGDTSDKDSERPMLTPAAVRENMKSYSAQLGKIIDLKKAELHYNSQWLKKLGFLEIAEMADQFSLHEFESRELIAKRLKAGMRISLRELLYPLMQGYDSVATKTDLELGGTDQRFNLLAGRTLQKHYGQRPQNILTLQLLEGTDGRKMSSSWGNVIAITDAPGEMFGKTMSILDSLIVRYYTLCTTVAIGKVSEMASGLTTGKVNPRDAKFELARQLVAMYHGTRAADAAAAEFNRVHKDKQMPDQIRQVKIAGKNLVDALVSGGLAPSNSSARRLIEQGGIKIDSQQVKDPALLLKKGQVLQAGKRNFIKAI